MSKGIRYAKLGMLATAFITGSAALADKPAVTPAKSKLQLVASGTKAARQDGKASAISTQNTVTRVSDVGRPGSGNAIGKDRGRPVRPGRPEAHRPHPEHPRHPPHPEHPRSPH